MAFHPIQAVCTIGIKSLSETVIVAACGPKLLCCNSQTGTVLSTWSTESAVVDLVSESSKQDEPRGQKRKIGHDRNKAANIIKLVAVPKSRLFIAVTGDDKCIRVFETSDQGIMNELSQRCMPKRPCAIVTDSEGQTIFCADKFGDAYSLPVIYDSNTDATPDQYKDTEKVFVPAATNLTVHTRRNRQALENQLRCKAQKAPSKEPLRFQHELLLGHVSMLTDIQHATTEVEGRRAAYIITADRDEHIRISRGAPQSHVIERFCLGHREFVSKIRLVPSTKWLVSGGGDDWLGVWDWTTGILQARHEMRSALGLGVGDEKLEIAVSGLWLLPIKDQSGSSALLVAFEKGKSVLLYDVDELANSEARPTLVDLSAFGNLLDVVNVKSTILASFDIVDSEKAQNRVQTFQVTKEANVVSMHHVKDGQSMEGLNAVSVEVPDRKALDDMLYGIENLRKRDWDE